MDAALMEPLRYYATHSPVTDPQRHRDLLAQLPADPVALCQVQHGLVIHLGLGHLYGWPVPPERMPQAYLRGVAAILSELLALDARPLQHVRQPAQRFVGHCRVASVVYCAMLRSQGIPACVRAGFRGYDGAGFNGNTWDHWICEYWQASGQRWVLTDPEQDAILIAATGLTIDPYDLPRDRFITAGQAWLACRSGDADPDTLGFDPSHAGMDYVRAQLLRDLAALNKWEPGTADMWGLSGLPATQLAANDWELLDQVAAATAAGPAALPQIRALYLGDPRLRPALE